MKPKIEENETNGKIKNIGFASMILIMVTSLELIQ